MTAFRLFFLSFGALAVGILSQHLKVFHQNSQEDTDGIPKAIKQISAGGMVAAAFWAVLESTFWRVVLLTYSVFTIFAIFLPGIATIIFSGRPELEFIAPLALGVAATNWNKDTWGQIAAFSILTILGIYISINILIVTFPPHPRY